MVCTGAAVRVLAASGVWPAGVIDSLMAHGCQANMLRESEFHFSEAPTTTLLHALLTTLLHALITPKPPLHSQQLSASPPLPWSLQIVYP